MSEIEQLRLPIRRRSLPVSGTIDCWLVNVSGLALDTPSDGGHRAVRVRQQFLLRLILGAYLDCPGKEIRLLRDPVGKPALAEEVNHPGLQFNLSHSGSWLAIAVARGAPVGIDIERHRTLSRSAELARRYFSSTEAEAVAALDEPARSHRFFELWTVREAHIKAMGSTLAVALRHMVFAPEDGRALELPAHWPALDAWSVLRPPHDLPVTMRIATPCPGCSLQLLELDCGPA
ncbi:MAG: 4'-phosphopantetheinyl transferase superfamily protein [Wenzhouxiangella sp.]|nr:MAG: 4'-phosphopantetheinyl transferase superfamily protein [Wenzhouxiangella sp.]